MNTGFLARLTVKFMIVIEYQGVLLCIYHTFHRLYARNARVVIALCNGATITSLRSRLHLFRLSNLKRTPKTEVKTTVLLEYVNENEKNPRFLRHIDLNKTIILWNIVFYHVTHSWRIVYENANRIEHVL